MTTPMTVGAMKQAILVAAHQAGEGHVASAFSILDALVVLYRHHVNIDPTNPFSRTRDYVILSKGHGCLALYVVLADRGFFHLDKLSTFCKAGSNFGGHPHRCKIPGVEASTGSLGHGLPMAVGIAKVHKIRNAPNKVYCIIGDGELNEGACWESLLLAEQHKLDNLVILVDYNHSNDRAINFGWNLVGKIESFGCQVTDIPGHDLDVINRALGQENHPGKPHVIVLNTTKGKGVREMENNPAWHHRAPTADELAKFLEEVQ